MGGKDLDGKLTETMACNNFNCPIDCKFNEWGPFGTCSKTCAHGGHERKRTKTVPQHGGKECVGPLTHTAVCAGWMCPTDCKWTEWDAWMPCTKTCGGGATTKSRGFDPRAQNGGKNCKGEHMIMMACNDQECPVDCFWEDWLDWSLCSKSCGEGRRTRLRLINVSANHGGAACAGDPTQEVACDQVTPCPEDCRFDEWGDWSECNATCGKGTRTATRVLLEAENGGNVECPEGDLDMEGTCESDEPCPEVKAGAESLRACHLVSILAIWLTTILAHTASEKLW